MVFPLFLWTSLLAQLVKSLQAMQETPVRYLGQEDQRRDRLPTPVFLGFPHSSAGKESTCNVGDLGSVPGLGRSPGEGKVFWPGEFHGLYSPWGHRELGTTERLSHPTVSLFHLGVYKVIDW